MSQPTCGVMSQNVDPSSGMISTTSTFSRMSQSSPCPSSYHIPGLNVPPYDVPHIQISNTDMEEQNLGMHNEEEVFDSGTQMPPRHPP